MKAGYSLPGMNREYSGLLNNAAALALARPKSKQAEGGFLLN